jgi:O-antigen ligase
VNNLKNIASYSGIVFGFALMGPLKWLSIITIILVVIWLLTLYPYSFKLKTTPILTLLLFSCIALGVFTSHHNLRAGAVLERSISLFVFPLFLMLGLHHKLKLKNPLIGLTAGVMLSSLIAIVLATIRTISTGSFYEPVHETHFVYHHFFHQNLTKPIGVNAVYLAHAAVLSLLFILHKWATDAGQLSKKHKSILAFFALYILIVILLCKSVMAFVCFLFILILFIAFNPAFKAVFKRFKLQASIALAAMLGLGVWVVYSKFQVFDFAFDFSDPYLRPLQIRLAIWQSAFQKISAAPWLGYGTGDSLAAMIAAYQESDFTIGLTNSFNAHNTYFELWLQIGVIGPLLFVLMIVNRLITTLKTHAFLSAAAVLIIAFFSLSESVLLTFRGVAFVCFCLFLLSASSSKKHIEP